MAWRSIIYTLLGHNGTFKMIWKLKMITRIQEFYSLKVVKSHPSNPSRSPNQDPSI
jgi:hypothetical protein